MIYRLHNYTFKKAWAEFVLHLHVLASRFLNKNTFQSYTTMSGPNCISQWEQTFTDQSFLIYTGSVVSHTRGCTSNALDSVCFHCALFSGVLPSLFLQRRFSAVYRAVLGKCSVSAWQQLRGWGLCLSGVRGHLNELYHVLSTNIAPHRTHLQSSHKLTRGNNCTDNQNTTKLRQLDTPVTLRSDCTVI